MITATHQNHQIACNLFQLKAVQPSVPKDPINTGLPAKLYQEDSNGDLNHLFPSPLTKPADIHVDA